jgi:hypothetical protein
MEFGRLATTEASALVERLVVAMATEVEAATKQTQATADIALAEAAAEVKQVTSALTKVRTNEQTLLATIDEVRAEAKGLRTALDESRAETQTLQRALEETRGDEKALRSTIQRMEADQAKHRETLELAVQKVRDRCAATQVELEKITAAKAAADAQYQKAYDAWSEEIRAAREAGATAASADLEYLRGAFQRLDAASTLTEAVNGLANSLAAVFPRVALFDVKDMRLEGRQQTGFDFENSISKVIVALTNGSAFDEAVQSGRTRQLSAADLPDANKTLFGGAPNIVLILPVVIEGTTAAVVYADDSGQTGPQRDRQRAASSAEVLLLHAMPLLARLSVQEKLAAYESQLLNDLQIV